MSRSPRILIAGLGNELLSDDGGGIHAARELEQPPLPGVTVADIGTAILHGLQFLEAADLALVIDAAKGGQPPGTIYLFDTVENAQAEAVSSIHAMSLREAARLLMAGKPIPRITVLGVEPESLTYGMTLSAPVRAALPRVISLARETIARWQSCAEPPSLTTQPGLSLTSLGHTPVAT
jgi:hydrogenase maturation protease